MYLGYNTNGLAHHKLEDALEIIRRNAFSAVGITIDHGVLEPNNVYTPHQIEFLQEYQAKYQFKYVIETGARFLLNPFVKHEPTLVSPLEEERRRRLDFYKYAVDSAAAINAQCVSIWSGICRRNESKCVIMNQFARDLIPLLDYAQQKGVSIAFEPEPGMFIGNLRDFSSLLERLNGDSRLNLTLDVGHLVCNQEPIEASIIDWKDRLINVHLEDMHVGIHEHLPFGTGEVNFTETFQALKKISYSYGVYVELSRDSHRAVEAVESAAEFLQKFR